MVNRPSIFGALAVNSAKFLATKVFPRSNFFRKIYHSARNYYESGWPGFTGSTSYVPAVVQDSRWDQNYVTRREILRKMRYWSQNSPLCEAILSVGERYTVGSAGLPVTFYPSDDLSEDAENSWYERADTVINEWFNRCGWNDETMATLLKVGYRCQRVDGEVFFIKTRKNLPLVVGNRTLTVPKPVLQMVEAHRVESPWNRWDDEGHHMIDGVQFKVVKNVVPGVDGKSESADMIEKVGYWMRNSMGSFQQDDSWRDVAADSVFHIFNPTRANQYRGISDFYAVEVNLHKLEDLLTIEMKAQNTQSIRAVGIETASGQAASPLDRRVELSRVAMGQNCAPATNLDDVFNKRCETYRNETGAYVYGLKLGEKVHFDSPTRPAESTLMLWEYLTNSICAGTHSPRCLVFEKISNGSAKSQGTEVRAQLDSADAFYKGDFQKWKIFVRDSVIWFMEWAIKNDFRVADPPANWRDCIHIHAPEACNVDVQNNATAQLMMLAAGASDYDMILGPQGLSFMQVARRLKRQQAFLEKNKIKVSLPALLASQIPLDGTPKGQQPVEKEVA